MVSWFIFVQHGSHGALKDFDPLSEAINRHFSTNLPQQQQQQHRIKIFGTKVNERLGTDEGTMKCVDKIMPELEKALIDFCCGENESANADNICYFSCVSHSFGGILTREVIKRLFEKSSSSSEQGTAETTVKTLSLPSSSSSSPPPKQVIKIKPVQFVSVASPHCGVNSIEFSLMRWGGRLLGKIYSSTYQELFLDSPLLLNMAGVVGEGEGEEEEEKKKNNAYINSFTSFQDHLFVGAISHDYLVRFETATLIPLGKASAFSSLPSSSSSSSSSPTKSATPAKMRTLQNRKDPSTHVFEPIEVKPTGGNEDASKNVEDSYTQLNTNLPSLKIAASLRNALLTLKEEAHRGFRVMPVRIPAQANLSPDAPTSIAGWVSPQWFCIAHDALMKKGVSWDVLPDVVEAVAEEMVSIFFKNVFAAE